MPHKNAAVTTGFNIASRILKGETVDPDELVEIAIKTGADTSLKVVTAGTLQVAIRKWLKMKGSKNKVVLIDLFIRF